jgi:hypothetical protein
MITRFELDVFKVDNTNCLLTQLTVFGLSTNVDESAGGFASIIGKIMLEANFDALKFALKNLAYAEMVKKGGIDLLFVQLRAMANKAAQKALANAGGNNLEVGIFRTLLERLGANMAREAGLNAIPILGALVVGLNDTYFMHRICKAANLFYHKRFIFEKGERVSILFGDVDNR